MEMFSACAKARRLGADERAVALGRLHRSGDGIEACGQVTPHLLDQGAGLEQEDARIPGEAAAVEIVAGARFVGLLDEPEDAVNALGRRVRAAKLDIAILRVGLVRADAERHQAAAFGRGQPLADGGMEAGDVVDHMIRRHQQQDLVLARSQRPQRRHGRGGRGVAADRLEQDRLGLEPRSLELALDEEAVILAGDDDRGEEIAAHDPRDGGLEHGFLRRDRQQLLGKGPARKRPQARPGAAGHDDWADYRNLRWRPWRRFSTCRASGQQWARRRLTF